MKEIQTTLRNRSGLHARPAAQFTQAAGKFTDTKIKIIKEDHAVDAKSILGVMSMGLTCGTAITLQAEGPDEAAAVKALAALVESGFGEL
jgi:Phosphotransferase System HPr (HPr) Family